MKDQREYIVQTGDPDVEALLDGYLQRRRDDVLTARSALRDRDFESLRRLGHNLHGSGAAYGVAPISAIGRDLERAAALLDSGHIEGLIDRLENFLKSVRRP